MGDAPADLRSEVLGWGDRDEALAMVRQCREAFQALPGG